MKQLQTKIYVKVKRCTDFCEFLRLTQVFPNAFYIVVGSDTKSVLELFHTIVFLMRSEDYKYEEA